MHQVRQLKVSFELVFRNSEIIGYPLCFLYILRGSSERISENGGRERKNHKAYMYYYTCVRLFLDIWTPRFNISIDRYTYYMSHGKIQADVIVWTGPVSYKLHSIGTYLPEFCCWSSRWAEMDYDGIEDE